jgi:prophage regulatory protein
MKHAPAITSAQADEPQRLLARLPTVIELTGLGRSTIYRWIAEGTFPSPVRLGPRAIAWRWADLELWMQSRPTVHH